jgi:hypothetical protein
MRAGISGQANHADLQLAIRGDEGWMLSLKLPLLVETIPHIHKSLNKTSRAQEGKF